MRCFIAIDLPEEVRKELSAVQRQLPQEVKLIPVKPENIHLTLKFLGEISDAEINKVKEALKKLKLGKFKAKLNSLGIFTPDFVRIVWVNLEPKEEFVKLHEKIDSELEKVGFKKDKSWENHVTISRIKWLKDKQSFIEKINKISVEPIEFIVDSIKLKKSTLTKKGPVYEDIIKINLE